MYPYATGDTHQHFLLRPALLFKAEGPGGGCSNTSHLVPREAGVVQIDKTRLWPAGSATRLSSKLAIQMRVWLPVGRVFRGMFFSPQYPLASERWGASCVLQPLSPTDTQSHQVPAQLVFPGNFGVWPSLEPSVHRAAVSPSTSATDASTQPPAATLHLALVGQTWPEKSWARNVALRGWLAGREQIRTSR